MDLRQGFSLFGHLPTILGRNDLSAGTALTDDSWMSLAIMIAMNSSGLSEPNPAVGCVIVDSDGKLASSGSTEICGGRHAERVAIERLDTARQLRNATLYCTLEPWSHHGQQPPCSNLIAQSGIERCVIGSIDADTRVNGRGVARLRAAGLQVDTGILATETAAWHLPFLIRHTMKRPLFVGKWAQTLDGQLAFDTGSPRWISDDASRLCAHWLRQRYDAIMVGAGTALADMPRLTVRQSTFPIHRQPVRILFDPSGRVFRVSEVEWQSLVDTLFHPDAPVVIFRQPLETELERTRWQALAQSESTHLRILKPGHDPLDEMISQLSEPELSALIVRPLNSVLVEGGPTLLSLMWSLGYLDVAHIFQSAAIGGGQFARMNLPSNNVRASLDLDVVNVSRIVQDVLIELANTPVQAQLGLHNVKHPKYDPGNVFTSHSATRHADAWSDRTDHPAAH